MLTAGDEFGRTQNGNNNAYAQDNEITWLDWAGRDRGWSGMQSRSQRLRRDFPALSDHGDSLTRGVRPDGNPRCRMAVGDGPPARRGRLARPGSASPDHGARQQRGGAHRGHRQWRPSRDRLFAAGARRISSGRRCCRRTRRSRSLPAKARGACRARTVVFMIERRRTGAAREISNELERECRLVARRGHLPNLSALVPGHHGRRQRRSGRHHGEAGLMSRRSASMPSGCRRSSSHPWPIWATTCPTIAPSIRCSGPSRISTRWLPRRTGLD